MATREDVNITITGTDEFTPAAKSAGSSLDGLKDKASSFGTVLAGGVAAAAAVAAAAIAGVTAAALKGIDAFADWGDKLDSLGDVLGTNASDSAALAVAIRGVGGNVDSITTQLSFLTKGLQGVEGKSGPTAKALAQLGVKAFDKKGAMRDAPDLLADVATKLSKMPDGLEKSALMMRLFGKSGKDLSDTMNALANGGLEEARVKARKLGLDLGESGVDSAVQFKRGIADMELVMQGLAVTIGKEVMPFILPALQRLGQWLIDNMPQIKTIIGGVIAGISGFATQAGEFINRVIGFVTPLVTNAQGPLSTFQGFLSRIGEAAGKFIKDAAPIAEKIGVALKDAFVKIQPSLETFGKWLQDKIPLAINAVKGFIDDPLMPAFRTIANFIAESVLPKLGDIAAFLLTNIPGAIDAFIAVVNDPLMPAFTKIWNFLKENVLPIFNDLFAIIDISVGNALRTLSNDFNNKFLPALKDVWGFAKEKIVPIFEEVGKAITKVLGWISEALQKIKDLLGLVGALPRGLPGGGGGAGGPSFTGGGGGPGFTRTVTVNVNVNGQQDVYRVAAQVAALIKAA